MPASGIRVVFSLMLLLIGACSTNNVYRAPVVDIGQPSVERSARTTVVLANGPRHRVNEGETLYAIAWMYDLYFQDLARANNIPAPYVIYPGQELTLDLTANRTLPASPGVTTQSPGPTPPRVSTNATGNAQTRGAGSNNNLLRWVWPTNGSVIDGFSSAENANKGINFSGRSGDPVYAAEAGEVVYAGSALLRYGELIIIKHNDQFLSAYAHNDSLSVSEGERVSRGQRIASLGSTGIDRDMLHFEIRLAGQPVNPADYLPPR